MLLNIPQAVPLVAFMCYTVLLAIVYLRSARRRVHRVFMLYLASGAVWSLGSFVWRLQASLFWNRVLVAGAAGTAVTFCHFVLVFLGVRGDRRWLHLGYGLFTIVLVANLLGYIVPETYFVGGEVHYEMGPGVALIGLYAYFYYGLSVYYLLREYRSTRNVVQRNRARYPIIGLSLIMLTGLSNFVPEVGRYPIDIAASVVNALLIAYAILRHQLLDIAVVVRKGLVYSTLTALLATIYLLVVFAFSSLFRNLVYGSIIPALVVASAIALAFRPLRDRAQAAIDRFFFREKYDAQLMLQELSRLAITILDISELASLLLDRLTATMHIGQAYIMLKGKEDSAFHLIAQKGEHHLEDAISLSEDHPAVRWMISQKAPLTRRDLDVAPQFRALWTQEREDLNKMGAELLIPLLVREELIGILILGAKLSEESYSSDELNTLAALANQTAVAIQNAWLYSDLEQNLRELKLMQAQLIQSEKLSAIGEMIAGVAHEINNSLTTIIGYTQLLQTTSLPPQARRDLERILGAGLRVKRIVSDLLDFSRQRPAQKACVDINEVVSQALGLCAHELMAHNVRIGTHLDPNLPPIMADRYQLQQVFVNLINNAWQAMADQDGPRKLAVVTERDEQHTIRISFRDTGPGIRKGALGRIFDPFFTTKEVGQGTGLGLSVSYGIVQEHGGRIWAESEYGQGATFFIELPVHAPEAGA